MLFLMALRRVLRVQIIGAAVPCSVRVHDLCIEYIIVFMFIYFSHNTIMYHVFVI
jgi:hypothetical protein